MKQLTPQSIATIALLVVAVLVGGIGYFAVVSPQAAKQQRLSNQILVSQSQLTAAQGLTARPIPFRASDLYRLAKAMPSSDDMTGILLELRNLAQQSHVEFVSIHPTTRIVLPLGYAALPLSVVVSGKYDAVAGFLGRLRKGVGLDKGRLNVNGRLFLADDISLQAGTKDVVSATLSLDAFVYAAPPIAAATPGVADTASGSTAAGATAAATPAGSAG